MDNSDHCCSTHLIDGDGNFNVSGIESFMKEVKLDRCGLSYAVVAIMGPQGSGKSTLLNNLFGTNFREAGTFQRRTQTTKGIWIARCVGIEPCTVVMDAEGTDGRERGEDDTAFEKQSALFALAISDVVLINMWCHDIGREQAANKPLLKNVFQVMIKIFGDQPKKTTLMFVLRDQTRTPLKYLETDLREDIQKIWDSVHKPQAHKETPLSKFFNVEVVSLPSFQEKEEQFKEQVAILRKRFFHSIAPGELAGDRGDVVHASVFSFNAQETWKTIKKNKDLDLPAHKVMVATVRCEGISDKIFASFIENEEWRRLEEMVQSQSVPRFRKKLSSILDACLSEYDAEATFFDEGVRSAKRHQLEEKLLQSVQPAYQLMLGHIRSETLERFKEAFESRLSKRKTFAIAARDCSESFMRHFDDASADVRMDQANWDSSYVRDELERDIDAHISAVRAAKLSELTSRFETELNEALSETVGALLDEASDNTWSAIRKFVRRETEITVSRFSDKLAGFYMDELTKERMLLRLENHAREIVKAKAREEARRVKTSMKERYTTLFNKDAASNTRLWTRHEDIEAITKTARSGSVKLLAVMAAMRLDDDDADSIEKTLFLALVENESGNAADTSISVDPLVSSSWDEVPSSKTLLTPVRCKQLWVEFKKETEYTITQARAALKASIENSWFERIWAIAERVLKIAERVILDIVGMYYPRQHAAAV